MLGNPIYMFLTIIIILAIVFVGLVLSLTKRSKWIFVYGLLFIPILSIFLYYLWNWEFQLVVHSFLMPSKTYECTPYSENIAQIFVPLPTRTVFLGAEDHCSHFYITYVNVNEFKSFYINLLEKMKQNRSIKDFNYRENREASLEENKGFVVQLVHGDEIHIFFKKYVGSDHFYIDIDYQPT